MDATVTAALAEVQDAIEALSRANTPTAIMQRLDELKGAAESAIDAQAVAAMLDPVGRWSWTRLGAVLGISRQAAHKRWSKLVEARQSEQFHERHEAQPSPEPPVMSTRANASASTRMGNEAPVKAEWHVRTT